jgi:hypothetical protein
MTTDFGLHLSPPGLFVWGDGDHRLLSMWYMIYQDGEICQAGLISGFRHKSGQNHQDDLQRTSIF